MTTTQIFGIVLIVVAVAVGIIAYVGIRREEAKAKLEQIKLEKEIENLERIQRARSMANHPAGTGR